MRNSKKLLIGVLSVAALIGTGYAAWTIGGVFTDATQDLNPIVEETIGTRDIALQVSKDENDNIKFDSKADLSVTYNVKAVKADTNLIEDFDPYDLSYYEKVAEDYQPDLTVSARALDSTTGKPLDAGDEFFKIVNLPKEVTYEYNQWLAKDYKDNGFPVELVFTWGDFTDGLNPQEYVDSQLASKTQKEQRAFLENIIDNLKGVKFEFTFKVEGAVIDDPEPVEDITGKVTAPSVANSTFLIDGETISGNLKAGKHQITITTADGKVVKDNKLIVVENGVDKEVTLTDSLTRAAHTYTATYDFLKDVTYSFEYSVVDEVVVEEPVVVEKGKLGFWNKANSAAYYFTGDMDGYYGGTTTDFASAAGLTVFKNDDNKYIIQIDGTNTYIGAKINGNFKNFVITDTEYAWDYDVTNDTYTTILNGVKYFMGTHGTFDTIGLSDYDKYINNPENYIARISENEILDPSVPEEESLMISANPSTIKVGDSSKLSYKLSPEDAVIDGTISYEVFGENDGVVSLEGDTVTGLKKGSVQIIGKIGALTSKPIIIDVIAEDAPVGDSVVYEYTPTKFTDGTISNDVYPNKNELNVDSALKTLSETISEEDPTLINSVTSVNKLYSDDAENSGIKFSTKSGEGVLGFTTTSLISKIDVTYISRKGDSTSLTVKAGGVECKENGEEKYKDGITPETHTYECANPATEFEFTATKRLVITKLVFWLA